ncbi:MAG TPA: hypothetical protein VK922_00230 [Gemmatimonadaceae bacterium]|nr:hypothetical protein [Gemmatimonadaceae bacterium]
MAPTELRPRSATEILDAAFQILKQQYGTFVVLAALAYLPYIVFMIVISASVAGAPPDEVSMAAASSALLSLPIALVWFPVAEAAVLVGASDALLGRPVDAGSALRAVFSRFGSVLLAALMKGMLVILATLFFIVPGVIVWLGLFATPAVVVFERLGAVESLGRSWNLAKGLKGKIFGVMVLAYLVIFAIQIAVAMIAAPLGVNDIVANIAASVLVIFVYPLIGICMALLYYDARIRKEGFDLQVLAGELQGTASGSPYAGAR